MDSKSNSTKKTKKTKIRHKDLNQLTDHECKTGRETETESVLSYDGYPPEKNPELRKQRKRLNQNSRGPGKCPLSRCDQMVFPTALLQHLLHKHASSGNARINEVFDHQPIRMHFNPFEYPYGEVHLLAILMFGGVEGEPETLPGRRYVSFPNTGLMHDTIRLENHLPIMVLICKTTWYALLPDKRLEKELVALNSDSAAIYVIWLVSPALSKTVYYTMTIFDRSYTHSSSVIRKIRNLKQSQKPSEFLRQEDNYMILRQAEVKHFLHSDNKGKGIQMELIVHESPNAYRTPKMKIKYIYQSNDLEPYQRPNQPTFNLLQMPRIKAQRPKLTRKPTGANVSSKKKRKQ